MGASTAVVLFTHDLRVHDHPERRTDGKLHYGVFTPYHRAWLQAKTPGRTPLPAPSRISMPAGLDPGPRPDPKAVRPESIDLPPGGETAARRHLDAYLQHGAGGYEERRDDMAADATSRLSPYLRFGCLSANELVHRLEGLAGTDALIRQLAWRDFFGQLLASDGTPTWRDLREPPATCRPCPRTPTRCWRGGRRAAPGFRWSTPACASYGGRDGSTTGRA